MKDFTTRERRNLRSAARRALMVLRAKENTMTHSESWDVVSMLQVSLLSLTREERVEFMDSLIERLAR